MLRLSIRWKLTFWYGLILALLLTAFSATVYWTVQHRMRLNIDRDLTEELSDVRFEVGRAGDSASMLNWLDRRFSKHEGFDFQVIREDGQRIFASERMLEKYLPQPKSLSGDPIFETVKIGLEGSWRLVSMKVASPEGLVTIQVARSMTTFEHESSELLWAFLLAGPVTVLITLAGGYFLARRTLAPVQKMSDTARQISAEQLQHRLSTNNPDDELGQLATTMNAMLDRLEHSFTEMQRFTADAAHELRTPLAVIRNEAEVALRQHRSGEEYARVLENLLEETIRLGLLADQLLFLSRQDAGLNPPRQNEFSLDQLLQSVIENMQPVAQEKGIALALTANPGCLIRGDELLLRRVFYNLIDNAIKYTSAGGSVTLNSTIDGVQVAVTIEDTGIGISGEHLKRVFDRFYRVDASRTGETGGIGLGLSICKSIVSSLNGSMTVESVVGKGSTFTVRLPL